MDRTRLDQIGFNFLSTGAGNTLGTLSTQQFGPITGAAAPPCRSPAALRAGSEDGSFGLSDLLNIFIFNPSIDFGAVIKALQENPVLQVLAEPNLLALSGSKASFSPAANFLFRLFRAARAWESSPYGSGLRSTPGFQRHLGDDDTVRLQVAPEVSGLDFTNAVTVSGFTVPAIATAAPRRKSS